jgi:DNA-binding winged helix-turn-helix (wHTH) protein
MEPKEQSVYEFGPFVLDTAQHLLLRDQQPLPLTPKTYDTLLVLVENSGRMLSKNELMQAIWPESFVEESNLTVQISAIRKVLGEQGYIVTIPSRGYRFGIDVKERRRTSTEDGLQERDGSSRVSQIGDSSREDWQTSGVWPCMLCPGPCPSQTGPAGRWCGLSPAV